MNHGNTFVKGFKRIENLQTIPDDNLNEGERELNKAITRLINFAKDVNQLDSKLKTLSKAYFEYTLYLYLLILI